MNRLPLMQDSLKSVIRFRSKNVRAEVAAMRLVIQPTCFASS
jgi:hypothetical protein